MAAEIAALGDFRPGSISATGGRCGTQSCHCHKPGDSGHGPDIRLTYKADGKTVTESFSSPAAQRKAEREIAAFRSYRELSRTLIETNEKICRARPVEDTLTPRGKKTAEIVRREVEREIGGLLRLIFQELGSPAASIWKRWRWLCGLRCILTVVGEVELLRPWYPCRQCHRGKFPADAGLDIEGTELSPGVRRMLALVGSEAPFGHGHQQLQGAVWAADGGGWFVTSDTEIGIQMFFVFPDGRFHLLGDIQGWAVPAPDGRRVAFMNRFSASNAWVLDRRGVAGKN